MDFISIKGASENNLKGFDIQIPKKKIVVFTGKSGAGKSSLVFDIIAKEAQRQLNETFPLYIRHKFPLYERPKVLSIENLSPAIVVDQKQVSGSSRSTVSTFIDVAPLFRLLFSRLGSPIAGVATAYSFNSPRGMCPTCHGIGDTVELDLDKLLDKNLSLNQGAIQFKPWAVTTWQWRLYGNSGFFDNDKPLSQYTEEEWHNLLHGSGRKVIIENDPSGVWYEGVVDRFNRLYLNKDISNLSKNVSNAIHKIISIKPCRECHGKRLNQAALASKINGLNIADVFELEIIELIDFLESLQNSAIGKSLSLELLETLSKVVDLSLGYLTLSRKTETLSGGEAQRLKLVKHLRSNLTDMTYIFDEPSIGMHPHDIERIIKILFQLRDKGNSVLVVEHEPMIIQSADHIIDIGLKAGEEGGNLIYQGDLNNLYNDPKSITGYWLKKGLELNSTYPTPKKWISLEEVTLHNLKNISVQFPKGMLTTVTGVSGSGKSSLVLGALAQQVPSAIVIDQKSIGVSSRSNLATYLGIMDLIRDEFSKLTGVSSSMFSFNSQGKCSNCSGKGVIEADMVFADPVIEICEECHGKRYSAEALQYKYQGKNISDVLAMTVKQASDFFQHNGILEKLSIVTKVGLDYITLGQMTSSLSGGEIQRIKLAEKLQFKNKIYLLDEPTNGLHIDDIEGLLTLLESIVAEGNTVIVIEHDLQVIAKSDWIIELGPNGGRLGGEVLFSGTPKALLDNQQLVTSKWLKKAIGSNK